MSLKYKYDQSVASVNRMIDRMEQTEGYKPENITILCTYKGQC